MTIIVVILAGCGLRSVDVVPDDAELYLHGEKYDSAGIAKNARRGDTITAKHEGYHDLSYVVTKQSPRDLDLELTPFIYELSIVVTPGDAELTVDGEARVLESVSADAEDGDGAKDRYSPAKGRYELPYGRHTIEVTKNGFEPVRRELFLEEAERHEIRLMNAGSRHEFIAEIDTGVWPKQVIFSPDGEKIVIPLLKGEGIDIIDFHSLTISRYVVPEYGEQRYFPDGLFSDDGTQFYLSQMPTDKVHVLSFPGPKLVRSFDTGGIWSKVVVFSPDKTKLLVSNWVSNDISVFDTKTLTLERTLSYEARTPRGLAFTPDGTYLYITYFDSGHIIKARVDDWSVEKSFATGGANRDVVIDSIGKTAYVSNMTYGRIYVVDIESDTITKTIRVGHKPNTIHLTPDETTLYVSCRGPNNPVDYELPSPEDGEIYVIDTESLEIVEVIPGGNQPTGLDISPDGAFLAFSNFQDNNIEIYRITR